MHDDKHHGGVNAGNTVRYVITPDNLKFYCRQLCKVALRYADKAEVMELTSCFEQMASLMVNGNFGVAASMPASKLNEYCFDSCKIVTRHASPSELNKISLVIEVFIAKMLAGNYRPGLNSAAYEVYNKYVLRDRAINDIVSQKLDEIARSSSVNHSPRMGGNDHE